MVVGRTHQAITYAVSRGWIKVYGTTGRGHFLFTRQQILSYADSRNLQADFSRLEMTA